MDSTREETAAAMMGDAEEHRAALVALQTEAAERPDGARQAERPDGVRQTERPDGVRQTNVPSNELTTEQLLMKKMNQGR